MYLHSAFPPAKAYQTSLHTKEEKKKNKEKKEPKKKTQTPLM